VVENSGGRLSSDAGLLVVREFDERIGLTARFAAAIHDTRLDPDHCCCRWYGRATVSFWGGLIFGYEDQNDRERTVVIKAEHHDAVTNRRAVVPNRRGAVIVPQGVYDDYLVACVVQRLGMLWNHWRGMTVHSRYSGYPWLLESHVRMSETTFKTWIEPPFVALCAWGMQLYVDRLLETYLLLAACALHLQCRLWTQQEHIQQLDLRDGWIEQHIRASRFRAEQEHRHGRWPHGSHT